MLRGFCRHHSPNWGKDLARPWGRGRGREGEAYPEADHDCRRMEDDISGRLRRNHVEWDLHMGVTPTRGAETPA